MNYFTKKLNKVSAFTCISAAIVALSAGPLNAQNRGNADWYVTVAPYVWFSSIGGSLTNTLPYAENIVGDFSVPVHDSDLQTAWAARFELGKGRYRLWSNVLRSNLSNDAEFTRVSDPTVSVNGTYDFTWLMVEMFGAVQVGSFKTNHAIETYAGARYVRQDQNLTATGSPATNVTETWVDPVLGVRYFYDMGGRFWTTINTDIGGFGVGSEFTWTLAAELGFRIAKPVDVTMRYVYQEVGYDNGKDGSAAFKWDNGVAQGWLFGLVLTP